MKLKLGLNTFKCSEIEALERRYKKKKRRLTEHELKE